MTKGDVVAAVAALAVLAVVAADLAWDAAVAPAGGGVPVLPGAVEPSAGKAEAVAGEATAMEQVGAVAPWLAPGYLTKWVDAPRDAMVLLDIDETRQLQYYRTASLERNHCVVANLDTGLVTPVLSTGCPVFGRDLGDGRYGLIAGGDMVVFARDSLLPVEVERDVALEPPDLLSSVGTADSGEWPAPIEIPGSFGGLRLAYQVQGRTAQFLLVGGPDTVVPLFATCENPAEFRAELLEQGLALRGELGWLLLLEPDTGSPVALYQTAEEVYGAAWEPLGSFPYGGGSAEVGVQLRPGAGELFYSVVLKDRSGFPIGHIPSDIPYCEPPYPPAQPTTISLFEDCILLSNQVEYRADRLGAGEPPYCSVGVISLSGGSSLWLDGSHQVFFYRDYVVSLGLIPLDAKAEQVGWPPGSLVIHLWRSGREMEVFQLQAPGGMLSKAALLGSLPQGVYRAEENVVEIDQRGQRYRVDLNDLSVGVEANYAEVPQYLYATSEDGRYQVASIQLAAAGDGHLEELYVIDGATGRQSTLTIVAGGYGYWGLVRIIGEQVAVVTDEINFYSLYTGEQLPLTLPGIENDHTVGVVYDPVGDRYIVATATNAWGEPDQDSCVLHLYSYDRWGNLHGVVPTSATPGYNRYGSPQALNLTYYNGQLYFYHYRGSAAYEPIAGVMRFDMDSAVEEIMPGHVFFVAGPYLITVEYEYPQQPELAQALTVRKYLGDQLQAQVTCDGDELLGEFAYNQFTGVFTVTGRYSKRVAVKVSL